MKAIALVPILMLSACTSAKPPEVQVSNVWAQPVDMAGTSAAIYMTITEKCSAPDVLRSVTAKAPLSASLHKSSVVNNALRMQGLGSVPVACGQPTTLKPMGMHVMVTGISTGIRVGDHIPLTLSFEKAGTVEVIAEVTTMAVLEDVDPMHMNGPRGKSSMDGMKM